jgi:hypothetical protein
MVSPGFLDILAKSNMERFHAEAAQDRLVSAALGPRPSRARSLGRRLWAMAAGSVGALRESASVTPPGYPSKPELGRSPHRALTHGGVNPS